MERFVNPAAMPSPAPLPETTWSDADLEREMFLLLSKLEHGRSLLSRPGAVKRPDLALEVLIAMLERVVALVGPILAQGAVVDTTELRLRLREVDSGAQGLIKELRPSAMKSVLGWFGKPGAGPASEPAFRQTVAGFLEVFETCFALFEGRFQAPAGGRQWRQVYHVFLAELGGAVKMLHC
jgi:hypothetical protein